MQLAELLWNGITDDIPSHVTVLDWVEKCGLSITKGCMKRKTAEEAYSIIFDNSITVCGQDLHLELKASSEHPGHSLKHADVSVLRMKAGKGWNTEMIKGQLEQTIKEEGRKPDYVVSDNGQIMCIASETLGLTHHKDISHSFGVFLESHASLVEELDDVMHAYEYMEQLCKQYGLSHKTASECRRYINQNLMTKGDRVRRLTNMLIAYFNREEALLDGDEVHNITSDIIESTFGCFKARMSPNKNNGYTPLVL